MIHYDVVRKNRGKTTKKKTEDDKEMVIAEDVRPEVANEKQLLVKTQIELTIRLSKSISL